jgi:hypothetical protein
MIRKNVLSLALLLCLAPIGSALAQGQPPSKPIDAAGRHAVIVSLAGKLQANYVFPEVAKTLSTSLIAKESAGGYEGAANTTAFAEALSKDLREIGKDGHFQLGYDPEFRAPAARTPSKEEVEQSRREVADRGFGIQKVELLPGNVGYLEVRGFGPTEFVSDAFDAAMNLLSGSEALILDLRRNGGGEPNSVAFLMSHFFAIGDDRHLNDIYTRPEDSTRQYWTDPSVATRYNKPVYVLTSARTFSGGEECAYDFQTQKRATLVGETTGGGANPGDSFALDKGFAVFIPTGRAINPITHTNWEHVGVKPDVAVPAADALKTAHTAILRTFLASSKDPGEREYLQDVLAKVESGVVEAPNYKAPH